MSRIVCAAICFFAILATALGASDKPKTLVGLWEVKSATVDGDEVSKAAISPPYLRKGGIWRFEEDGTGKYGVTEMTWKYDPAKLQPLVVTEKDVFGNSNEVVKASVKYVSGSDDVRVKFELLGHPHVVILSPDD